MRLCLSFSIPHAVSQTCFWMTLPLAFCVGGCRPGLYPESCLVPSQGTSVADSHPVATGDLFSECLHLWGPGSGPCVGGCMGPDSPCPQGGSAAFKPLGRGLALGGWGFFCSARCTWSSQLLRVSLVLRTVFDRLTQSHGLSAGEGGHHRSCFVACQLPPVLETLGRGSSGGLKLQA